MERIEKTEKVRFPKGKYFIGDLCYVIDGDKDWEELMTSPEGDVWALEGAKEYKGSLVFSHGTYYGDGCYNSSGAYDWGFAVDSGTIGILPEHLITSHDWGSGVVAMFTRDFDVWYDDGTFHFGDLEIYTKCEDEEEEEYDEDEDDK